ncbi:MAG: hypothetical protein NTY87_02850 [Planctomycetia bacterium]|nr:hypothetical protein [Planctomycetia bacterium]RLT13290.1 MAG: hypothetical protein DWI25_07470 [Planctomycetota bacterium]
MPTVASHSTPPRAMPWSIVARAVLSLALCLYFSAVVLAPLAGPPPASELANWLIQPFRPFIGGLYLGHGYRFFAPDPGPGHSIRWSMQLTDGSPLNGVLPNPTSDWPRLLYHRRFMVSEKIAAFVPLSDAPEAIRTKARLDWQPLVKGVAGHLLKKHGGTQITLTLVEHFLPAPEDVLRSRQEPDLLTPLGTYAIAADRSP